MIVQQFLDTLSSVDHNQFAAAAQLAAPIEGDTLAANMKKFFAPLAAILIGVVALKFLFGENKSLAGFLGFMVLAIVVYGLIQFGDSILEVLSDTVASWVGANKK